jgi:hypothetical protein
MLIDRDASIAGRTRDGREAAAASVDHDGSRVVARGRIERDLPPTVTDCDALIGPRARDSREAVEAGSVDLSEGVATW